NMIMVIGPHRRKSEAKAERASARQPADSQRPAPRPRRAPAAPRAAASANGALQQGSPEARAQV
ncbi:MAG: translation initiation factor IF-3, partial [Actinobacteria bacterium]|nr:translation initiation factor IF-3 [Actinomycetota bacterium]